MLQWNVSFPQKPSPPKEEQQANDTGKCNISMDIYTFLKFCGEKITLSFHLESLNKFYQSQMHSINKVYIHTIMFTR